MTLTDTASAIRASLVAQLYDEWGGYYILQRLTDISEIECRPVNPSEKPFVLKYQTNLHYIDVRPLTRAEAETIRLRGDESLLLVW